MLRGMATVLLTCALSLSSSVAGAAEPGEGQVLRIEGPEVFVDLGRSRGGLPGTEVSLYRAVRVRDPGNGRALEDRFFVATGTIVEAGEVLARLEVSPSVAALLSLGDRVVLRPSAAAALARQGAPATDGTASDRVPPASPEGAAPTGRPRVGCPPPPATPVAAPSPDGLAFQRAFTSAATSDLPGRRQIWSSFVAAHPSSELVGPAKRELASLETLQRQLDEVRRQVEKPAGETLARSTSIVTEGEAVPVTLTVDRPEEVDAALLHYRAPGEKTLKIARMKPMGASTYLAEIPASEVRPPAMEWQVSVQFEGEAGDQRVDPRRPTRLPVAKAPLPPRQEGRSSVRLAYEYVDFYQFEGADAFSHFSADFLYRILAKTHTTGLELHSIRVGYGGFHGRGGPTREIEAVNADPARDFLEVTEQIGFNFGYAELELRLTTHVAVMMRGMVGIDRGGMAAGGEGRLRLGREDGTNLELGALSIGGLGESYLLQLSWDTVPRVPMSGRVEVTTHPARESDIGVRLIYEARYEFTDWFELGGQIGYGLRNIEHGGLSFGMTTVFNW